MDKKQLKPQKRHWKYKIGDIVLSYPMIEVLEQAEGLKTSLLEKQMYPGLGGWFFPQHHECARIYARWQTCEALRKMGLLEWRVYMQTKHRGQWVDVFEYRINENGISILNTLRNIEQLVK